MVVNFRLIFFFYPEFQGVTFCDLIPNREGVSNLGLAAIMPVGLS